MGAGQLRVVLVDDSTHVRAMLRRIVEDDNEIILVGEAENGREAVDLVGATAPDVVVMDVQMPVMDGIDATREITHRWPDVRVVGCSACEDPATAHAMTGAGASDHVDKTMAGTLLIPAVKDLAR